MDKRRKVFVVGIGASAGGLEAISQLIGHLKPDLPCTYVVLQHISPSYRSMMVEILARETGLSVEEAHHGAEPLAGHIYVVPANSNAVLREGRLHLTSAPPEVVPKPSINQFLISLAAEEGESAVGIVLSGTGSDGTAGLRAIQAAGGFTLVQSPETAKYDGMPRAAIDAGVVDHILDPEEIAAKLPELLDATSGEPEELPPDLLNLLLERLRDSLNVDFSGYKVGTLMRRIRRRELATGNRDLRSYLAWVDDHPEELDCLARDILISVTSFFRDRDAFLALQQTIRSICARKPPGSEIRVWIPGCASGEEAYSIAMLIVEELGDQLGQQRIQIFATDIDEDALNVARRGIYPAAALNEVGSERLQRFFTRSNQSFEATTTLRDRIIFARHNLVSDPPFLRLDLISCRNVLIYFDTPLQAKVLQTFHFGLVSDGHLFLGHSESVAQAEQLFAPVNRRERIFRKSGAAHTIAPALNARSIFRPTTPRRDSQTETLLKGLTQFFGAAAALCDIDGNILHTAGPVERVLQFPQGKVRSGISDALAPDLRAEILTLFHRCNKTGNTQRGRLRTQETFSFRMIVQPLRETSGTVNLVVFAPDASVDSTPAMETLTLRENEDELVAAREHLQTLLEEMATANEEMQSLHEEAQASNEELQASNEELEAANEELQATNEELLSVNAEMDVKTQELAFLNEEYVNLYDALQFPILVFDPLLQLIRYNAQASRYFDLRPTALKQPLARLRLGQLNSVLEELLGQALARQDREERLIDHERRKLCLSVAPGLDAQSNVTTLVATISDLTDITHAQSELSQSQTRLTALMQHTTVILAMKDLRGEYLFANQRFLEFFAIPDGTILGQTDFTLLPSAVAASIWASDLQALRERSTITSEHPIQRADGMHILRSVHQILVDADGHPSAFIMEAEDVTAARHAEEQLRITARIFDQAGEAIFVTNAEGRIQTINAAFTRLTGYQSGEIVGQFATVLRSEQHSREFYQSIVRAVQNEGFWQGEVWAAHKDGSANPEWLTLNRITDRHGRTEFIVAVVTELSRIKHSQRQAEHFATHDVLTGLPNRTLFQDRLRHALADARRRKTRVGLCFLDLDHFKTINDTLGHDIGDEVLKLAAVRLRNLLRDVDTVCRLGGDEFTLILTDCDIESVDYIARRIVDELSLPFSIQGRSLFISASVGVAIYPDDGNDSFSLIRAADAAMYRAKEQGRHRVEFFRLELKERLLKRAAIESGLRQALESNRLRLVYQPIYILDGRRRLVGAEALLRWSDPELGPVDPTEFIPIAEFSGQIVEITQWVQRELLGQISTWREMGLVPPPITYNLSSRCMRESDFSEQLINELTQKRIPFDRIGLDITENALTEHTDPVRQNIMRLSSAGLTISLDDFGLGYSSLSHLKQLPIHELKIDRSFVSGLGRNPQDEAITRAIIGLGNALDLRVIAEGVENSQQREWLEEQGCTTLQGNLFSQPLDPALFEDLMAHPDS